MKENLIILEGGLGNRMRVAASAYAMARRTHIPMRVLWTSQWGMPCRFDQLFKDPDSLSALPIREGVVCSERASTLHGLENNTSASLVIAPSLIGRAGGESAFSLRDAHPFESLLFGRPTLKNLYLPSILQRLTYRHIIRAPQIWHLNNDGFDYESWFRQGGTLMTAYRDFCPWTADDLRHLFVPNDHVQRLIDERTAQFSTHSIGVHIRRTDHQQAIDQSPLELFFQAIDRELDSLNHKPSARPNGTLDPSRTINPGGEASIYLATDDEATKTAMRHRYGPRVITSDTQATRESADGIRDALVEMFALSRTTHIYGSAGSTFSPIAACLGNVPITILQRDGAGNIDLLCPMNRSQEPAE